MLDVYVAPSILVIALSATSQQAPRVDMSMTRARRQRCVAAGVSISGRPLRDEGSDMCMYNNFYLAPQTPNEAFGPSLLQPALAAIAINMHTCSAKINGIPKARNYHMTVSRTHKLSSSIHLNLPPVRGSSQSTCDPLPSKRAHGADAIEATSIWIELLVQTGLNRCIHFILCDSVSFLHSPTDTCFCLSASCCNFMPLLLQAYVSSWYSSCSSF